MASELAPTLIENSLADLKGATGVLGLSNPDAHAWAQRISNLNQKRKRKINGNVSMDMVLPLSTNETGFEANDSSYSIGLQIAALEAIKALLTVVSPSLLWFFKETSIIVMFLVVL
jgi:hypothetical protein